MSRRGGYSIKNEYGYSMWSENGRWRPPPEERRPSFFEIEAVIAGKKQVRPEMSVTFTKGVPEKRESEGWLARFKKRWRELALWFTGLLSDKRNW